MRKLSVLFLVVLGLMVSSGAHADQLNDGRAAYDRGDYATALKLFERAAKQGSLSAQTYLGIMYATGRGVPQDYNEAVRLYELAAKQGFAAAQTNLGGMYRDGHGVSKDDKEAVRLFELAAKQGNADAQSSLGDMYRNGHGVPQDYVRAHMWLNLAASSNRNPKTQIKRELIAALMTPAQITRAQEMARQCLDSKYKACDTVDTPPTTNPGSNPHHGNSTKNPNSAKEEARTLPDSYNWHLVGRYQPFTLMIDQASIGKVDSSEHHIISVLFMFDYLSLQKSVNEKSQYLSEINRYWIDCKNRSVALVTTTEFSGSAISGEIIASARNSPQDIEFQEAKQGTLNGAIFGAVSQKCGDLQR